MEKYTFLSIYHLLYGLSNYIGVYIYLYVELFIFGKYAYIGD